MDGVGARHNELHISAAAKHVAPPEPFNGKTLDSAALESWLYQVNVYFLIKTSLLENLRVARAALLLIGNAATWVRA